MRADSIPAVAPDAIVGWCEKAREPPSGFKPEARPMGINFARRQARLHVQIVVPDGRRRSLAKVRMPACARAAA